MISFPDTFDVGTYLRIFHKIYLRINYPLNAALPYVMLYTKHSLQNAIKSFGQLFHLSLFPITKL